jgi:hypothetical protein
MEIRYVRHPSLTESDFTLDVCILFDSSRLLRDEHRWVTKLPAFWGRTRWTVESASKLNPALHFDLIIAVDNSHADANATGQLVANLQSRSEPSLLLYRNLNNLRLEKRVSTIELNGRDPFVIISQTSHQLIAPVFADSLVCTDWNDLAALLDRHEAFRLDVLDVPSIDADDRSVLQAVDRLVAMHSAASQLKSAFLVLSGPGKLVRLSWLRHALSRVMSATCENGVTIISSPLRAQDCQSVTVGLLSSRSVKT